MRLIFTLCLLITIGVVPFTAANAQKAVADTWRNTKKIRTDANGKQYTFEYAYTTDGRIETENYTSAAVQTIDKNANTIIVKIYTAGENKQYILTAINLKGVESEGTTAITVY